MNITRDEDLDELISFIESASSLSYDIETTGLNPRQGQIIGFGISDQAAAFYVSHLAWDGEKLVELVSKKACAEILRRLSSKALITFNGSFDTRFTYHYFGVNLIPQVYFDVMLAKHTTNEQGQFSLKGIAATEFGVSAKDEQAALKASIKANGGSPKEFYKADNGIMAKYCKQDCLLTYKLAKLFDERMMEEGTMNFFLKEVMPLYREVTIPMELKGIHLNLPLLEKTRAEINIEIDKLEEELKAAMKPMLGEFERRYLNANYPELKAGGFAKKLAEILEIKLPLTPSGAPSLAKKNIEALPKWSLFRKWMQDKEGKIKLEPALVLEVQTALHGGGDIFNLKSKDQLRYIFFSVLKEKPVSFTDKGVPSVDQKFLLSVEHKYDFTHTLIEFNKLCKLESTYMARFLERQEDGVYYAQFQQHRTTSGRYGGDLQQLPRAREEDDESSELVRHFNNKVRSFFIAGPGWKLVDADYNSLEVVVFADDAGDKALLDMIKNNEDFYSKVAIQVHGLEQEYSADKSAPNFLKKQQPKLRQDAKVYGLGIRYGMGDWKLSVTLKEDIGKCAGIIDKYFANFPKLKSKMDYYLNEVKTKGYVKSKAGRIRHLPDAKKIFEEHGDSILDVRNILKKYGDNKAKVDEVKKIRRRYNNMLNNALNYPIQSLAASIVNQSAIALSRRMREEGLKAYICLNVHDELAVRAPKAEVPRVVLLMKAIMENTIKLDAPLTADPQVGDNYGEVK